MNLNTYLNRATVRSFSTERKLDRATLDAILAAATHAPSTGNMQLYSVIVSTDAGLRTELGKLHFNQPAAVNAPYLLTFCADVRRFGEWCRARHAESGLDNAGGRLTAIIDATIFAQQFVNIAEQEGLGCCYLGTVPYNLAGFGKALDIPQDGSVIPLFSIAVGYPAEDAMPKPSDRLPLGAIVHNETYHAPTTPEIASWYHEKEQLDESARFIAENGKETLAQVYSEVRYPRQLNLSLGEQMMQAINNGD